jgi:hypothetical protein
MSEKFTPAREPTEIGRKLIKQNHDHLATQRVEFLFVERFDKDGNSQAITRRGKNLYGKAKLVTGLYTYLARHSGDAEPPPFFVILITKHFWEKASQEFKHALIDHELSHCWYDSDKDIWSMLDHDVTEFHAIVKRHGTWNYEIETFVNAAKQRSLQFDEETKEKNEPAPPAKPKPRLVRKNEEVGDSK